jgi:hypothetical protein
MAINNHLEEIGFWGEPQLGFFERPTSFKPGKSATS